MENNNKPTAPAAEEDAAGAGQPSSSPPHTSQQTALKKRANQTTDKNKDALIQLGADKLTGWQEVEEAHERATKVIALLDNSVNRALRSQEYQYLQAYNIFVRNKETQLRTLIEDFKNNKDSKNKDKDTRIANLEITI